MSEQPMNIEDKIKEIICFGQRGEIDQYNIDRIVELFRRELEGLGEDINRRIDALDSRIDEGDVSSNELNDEVNAAVARRIG